MDLQPEFPYPRSYKTLDGHHEKKFRYILARGNGKLLFLVKTEDGEELCVKFVPKYSLEAHRQCAELGIAPRLRGYEDVPGWQMIVMDFLKDYDCLLDVKESFSENEKKSLREGLRSGLTKLHEKNLVHGDVRDANVMVSRDRSRWMLVDFDWSGEIGKVRYPMNVNRRDFQRPEGAMDGLPILAIHDIDMLEYLFY